LFDAFSGLEALTGPVGRAENSLNATHRTTVLGEHPSPILAGTPLDQGNSKADVDTTAQIRKEIVAGKNMSVNAKNVKIITKDGQVTLRGPVNTAEEKRLIGEIADRIARSGNVDNQLEVKLTTSSNN
jgi:osmotically-inducible protein OsmY